ncbi:hypothetical protein CKO27_14985 [Thiocystis violacea]|nr:hypothetical protein [Thiocystis violacea]
MTMTRDSIPLDPRIAAFVARLDEDEREYFEERAAIAEYDGGLTRAAAEEQAYQLTLAYRQRHRQRVYRTLCAL